MSENSRSSAAVAERCDQQLINQAAQLVTRTAFGEVYDLANHETAILQRVQKEGSDESVVVVRHRHEDLRHDRLDHYFVLQPDADPPRLASYVDDLHEENELIAEGEFSLIEYLHQSIMEQAVETAAPADTPDGIQLNRVLHQITGR